MATLNATNLKHASAVSNNIVLAADGSTTISNLSGGVGKILQVVSTTKTDTASFTSNSTNTFVDLSGLSVSITPTATSSKILIQFDVSVAVGTGTVHVRLVRDSTPIAIGDAAGSRLQGTVSRRTASSIYSLECTHMSMSFLDSPNTTSATTYKLQGTAGSSYNTTYYVNRSSNDNNADYGARLASTITAIEVAA